MKMASAKQVESLILKGLQVRKVECLWCKGRGRLPAYSTDRKPERPELEICPNCGGLGHHIKTVKPRTKKAVKTTATGSTEPATYPPCPKCGQEVKITLWKDGTCYVDSHSTGPMLRNVCPISMQDGSPFLKKEPRSVQFRRDLKAKRRLDAAIKKHDAAEARRKLETLSYDLGGL